jgi:uncharacterized membrane protein
MRLRQRTETTTTTVQPLLEAAAKDRKLRRHAASAAQAGASAYGRMRRRGNTAKDDQLPDDVGKAARELTQVARRLATVTPERHRGRRIGLSLLGIVAGLAAFAGLRRARSTGVTGAVAERMKGHSTVIEAIEVDVPLSTAYNQWTQFEEFPSFMDGVAEVRQITDTELRWRASIGGQEREWTAQITEQVPDRRIAWRSVGGLANGGIVTFDRAAESRTLITAEIEYEPADAKERAADLIGATRRRVRGDLSRFKEMIEGRGQETGAWRGTVNGGGTATS